MIEIETKKIYPFDEETVFAFLVEICSKSRFNIKNVDKSIKRIIVSTPPSLFSYGENIEIIIHPEINNRALVYVKSTPKVFLNLTSRRAVKGNIKEIYRRLDKAIKENV